jgi:hypothetical protein
MPPSTHSYISEQTENGTKQDQQKAVRVDFEKYERKMKSVKIKARSGLSSEINNVQVS